ncbi:hypothetical protein GQX74_014673 [Glossina fuscipes]|nr:hypothetical protein GQX74_014673 [Glossina fuscipes]
MLSKSMNLDVCLQITNVCLQKSAIILFNCQAKLSETSEEAREFEWLYAIHRRWQELQEELPEDKLNSLIIKYLDEVSSQDILEKYKWVYPPKLISPFKTTRSFLASSFNVALMTISYLKLINVIISKNTKKYPSINNMNHRNENDTKVLRDWGKNAYQLSVWS